MNGTYETHGTNGIRIGPMSPISPIGICEVRV